MDIIGKNLIGFSFSSEGKRTFRAFDPEAMTDFEEEFFDASSEETDGALKKAAACMAELQGIPPGTRAAFLVGIADEIESLGSTLIDRARRETGLPEARITGERGRTTGQLRMFASQVGEGSWLEASIDTALPGRIPVPKPDLRKMLVPVGPVVVFAASNFPLAFSVAGGDTASALAAGNPVIVKAHPSHPGTSELVGRAIIRAAGKTGMPEGVFSLIHGSSFSPGKELVMHPLTRAVAFTGSLQGGKSLYDLASGRKDPIPVFAEMGSTNPVIILPEALRKRSGEIAEQLAASVNLGTGQFCTKPGLIFMPESGDSKKFIVRLAEAFRARQTRVMLNKKISENFRNSVESIETEKGLAFIYEAGEEKKSTFGRPTLAMVSPDDFLVNPRLHQEVFGPFSLLVTYRSGEEMMRIADVLEGQLTITLMAGESEIGEYEGLIRILVRKTGRIIHNGVPTGVEVCPSMHHGGPYPATTDARFTSVGTSAIKRFARPVCYQDWPEERLPAELRDGNPLNIWRLLNNSWTKEAIQDSGS